MDTFSREARSRIMSAIRSENTRPEFIVRKLLFALGYRFRLHDKRLPGRPDIVLKKFKTVIFVHGCFWHHHKNCRRANWPKSNKEYWIPKIQGNIDRDRTNMKKLRKLNWKIIILWECQLTGGKQEETLIRLIKQTEKNQSRFYN